MGFLSCNAESAIATCDSYNWNRRKVKHTNRNCNIIPTTADRQKHFPIRAFSCAELISATGGFSAESFLGKGSHGSVYRAILDGGSLLAAVKKTTFTADYNNHRNRNNNPTENEIEILSRIRNCRLVNLLGFAAAAAESDVKWIVVELMPNGSLFDLIHSNPRPPGWTGRVRLALQIAKAVDSLHRSNPPIIHRDIKSSNVLLDHRWKARLGDFGLALRGHVEDVRVRCTPPAGTLGYLDPCYLAPGDLSTKSDVFSFGILLLELLSGRNAIDLNYSPPSVVDWAVPLISRGDYAGICDPRVGRATDPSSLRQLAVLAARCVRSTAEKRPPMAEVVDCLKIVYKRLRTTSWNSLVRRRVESVRECKLPAVVLDVVEEGEETVKASRPGMRRNRKVSSLPSSEGKGELRFANGGDHEARSRSVGSDVEMKLLGSDAENVNGNGKIVKRMAESAVRMRCAVEALTKSRSMGVSRSAIMVRSGDGEEVAFQLLRRSADLEEMQRWKKMVAESVDVVVVVNHKKESKERGDEGEEELPLINQTAEVETGGCDFDS